MTHLSPDIATGVYVRAMRTAANAALRGGRVFVQAEGRVTYIAAPALVEAVAAHLYYDTQPAATTGTRSPGWRVTCVIDPDLWPSCIDVLDVPWRPCLDYGDPGAVANIEQAGRLVLSRTTRSVIAADHAEKVVTIVTPGPPGGFVESYKIVRHLLTTQLLATGGRPLHASAVAVDGNVLAFCGRKGAGKSTALLHALLSRIPGLGYVANDRLLLRTGAGTPQGLCWPTVAGFGGTLLASVGGLNELIDASVHLRGGGLAYMLLDLPLVEHVGDPEHPDTTPSKVRLTPSELTAVFDVPPNPGGQLVGVIEAALDLDRRTSTLTEVQDPDSKAAIVDEHVEAAVTTHPDWLGTRLTMAAAVSGEHDVDVALDGVRVFRLAAGRDFHDVVRGLCAVVGESDFAIDPPPRWHHGVYAAAVTDTPAGPRLLTVRKTRGPYTGMLDLPGGAPEPGEDRHKTLARELTEETGGTIHQSGAWRTFDIKVSHASDGRPIQFRHHGHWCETQLTDVSAPTKTDQDVGGLHGLALDDWHTRDDLSAPLQAVLGELTGTEDHPP